MGKVIDYTLEKSNLDRLFVARVENTAHDEITISPKIFAQMLEHGICTDTLRVIMAHIPRTIVAATIGIKESSVSNIPVHKRLSRTQTDQLNDLTKLWLNLNQFFDFDTVMLNEWLANPLPIVDGACPNDLIISQYGRDVIRTRLDEMRHGDFS
jgi:uncharacterized protein (DUF2384 family)